MCVCITGGDVGVVDCRGQSLLHKAVLGGKCDMVAALLMHDARKDGKDHRRGRTPLHVAALENELVMVKVAHTRGGGMLTEYREWLISNRLAGCVRKLKTLLL